MNNNPKNNNGIDDEFEYLLNFEYGLPDKDGHKIKQTEIKELSEQNIHIQILWEAINTVRKKYKFETKEAHVDYLVNKVWKDIDKIDEDFIMKKWRNQKK